MVFTNFEGVYHTQMIETYSNANARIVQTSYYAWLYRDVALPFCLKTPRGLAFLSCMG